MTEEIKPIATYSITNTMGIVILQIAHENGTDYVMSYDVVLDSKKSRVTKSEVRYTTKGEPYFHKHHKRIYLNECTLIK